MEKINERKVRKSALLKSFGRTFMYGASWNYERMQNLGFLYTMVPIIKDLYGDSKEKISEAMNRHLEFFNTQQSMAPFIIGVTAALEEKEIDNKSDAINGIKIGMMGPLAGLGDSLIWLTLIPIAMSLGATYSENGSVLGIIIALIFANILNIPFKYYSMRFGYTSGSEFIQNASKEKIDRITNLSIALGLILVGGLAAQMVNINIGFTFTEGDLSISIQEVLDSIFPKLLPLLTTFGIFKLLRKGRSAQILILMIIILSIILSGLGILA